MWEPILILVLSIVLTNLVTFHVTKVRERSKSDKILDGNIKQIIEHQNIIVRALANSNGFGEKFNAAYKEEIDKSKTEIKVIL